MKSRSPADTARRRLGLQVGLHRPAFVASEANTGTGGGQGGLALLRALYLQYAEESINTLQKARSIKLHAIHAIHKGVFINDNAPMISRAIVMDVDSALTHAFGLRIANAKIEDHFVERRKALHSVVRIDEFNIRRDRLGEVTWHLRRVSFVPRRQKVCQRSRFCAHRNLLVPGLSSVGIFTNR